MTTEQLNKSETQIKEKEWIPQYQDKFRLLNKSEQELFEALKSATPAYHVFSQVSMSQIFHMNDAWKYRAKTIYLNRIARKSIDFLLCRENFSIVIAIELNGPTHEREDRKKADETKAKALDEAGIPLLTYEPGKIPDPKTLGREIALAVAERRKAEEAKRRGINASRGKARKAQNSTP